MNYQISRDIFKDKHVIFVVTHLCQPAIMLFMDSVIKVLDKHPDTVLAIIDSRSNDEIIKYLKSLQHPQIVREFLDENIGKARAANNFIAKYIDQNNLPKTVWSMDPDIIFDVPSFDYLLEAIQNVPDKIGVLGARYKKNDCNPEINLWLPARKVKGQNGKTYRLVTPIMCCVAGPILAMKGQTLKDPLDLKLFPKKFTRVYGGDDSATYLELKRHGYKSAYLNGTQITHLRTAGGRKAEELIAFAKENNLPL
ncbi:glycosyltransferase family 2 protein [Candidatus Margulisiibacteriota bacterium]